MPAGHQKQLKRAELPDSKNFFPKLHFFHDLCLRTLSPKSKPQNSNAEGRYQAGEIAREVAAKRPSSGKWPSGSKQSSDVDMYGK